MANHCPQKDKLIPPPKNLLIISFRGETFQSTTESTSIFLRRILLRKIGRQGLTSKTGRRRNHVSVRGGTLKDQFLRFHLGLNTVIHFVRVACLGSALATLPNIAFALSPLSQGLGNPAPGAGATLQDFVYLLIDIIQWVALPVLALCIIYAGFTLVSAGGDEKKIASGKLWLGSSLIGAKIMLGERVVANIIFGTA